MKYKYKPEGYVPVVGDVVLWTELSKNCTYALANKPYLVTDVDGSYVLFASEVGTKQLGPVSCKVLDTKPGSTATVGDTVMCINSESSIHCDVGTLYTVGELADSAFFIKENNAHICLLQREGFVVLQQAEPELLHQEWRTLFDEGVELEYKSTCTDVWRTLQTNTVGYAKIVAFNSSNYEYRRKEKLMITDYVIDIKERSLADRLRLRQVLFDNGQVIWADNLHELDRYTVALYDSAEGAGEWVKSTGTATVSLEDFIQKFKKSDKVRNLAFTSTSEAWTEQELTDISKFVGDSGNYIYELCPPDKYVVDDGSSDEEFLGTADYVPEGSLVVSYEGVFPEAVEEPTKPEFEYPIYKQSIENGMVFKFSSLNAAECVVKGDSFFNVVGKTYSGCANHTDSCWSDWKPQFDYDTVMQPNTVIHATNESEANELLYWADKQGLKWPSQQELGFNNFKGTQTYYRFEGTFITSNVLSNSTTLRDSSVLTMDEARNGKRLPDAIYDDPIKEQTMDKPLLSDLLKQHGAYEKFLANLSVKGPFGNVHYNDHFKTSETFGDCVDYAFDWDITTEGESYWDSVYASVPSSTECINDVRAPDDIDYWDEQYQLGEPVFYYDTAEKDTGDMRSECSPEEAVDTLRFYSEEPTWLLDQSKETSTPTNKGQTTIQPKIGDKVIRVTTIGTVNEDIETVTDVEGERIWVSNTNSRPWALGTTWELYTCGAEASNTTASVSEEQTMDTNIEIKVNGETIKTAAKVNKPKSDFKLKPSVMALYHTADGAEIELKRFTGKTAADDAQAHLVTMIAKHPNAKMTPYTVGKSTKIKHQFEAAK